MRIYLASMAHPKRLSKRLSGLVSDLPLSKAQKIVANMFGYKDWHELEQVTSSGRHTPSKPDSLVSSEVTLTRRRFQEEVLSSSLPDQTSDEIHDIVMELLPSDSMPRAEVGMPVPHSLFPSEWVHVDLAPYGTPLTGVSVKISELRDSHVGALYQKRLTSKRQEDVALLPGSGYMVLTLKDENRTYRDMRPGVPPLNVVFHLTPTISDNIITGLEISFHPLSTGSEYLDDELLKAAADGFTCYLNACGIHFDSPGDVSGAVTGLYLHLVGVVRRPIIERFIASLEEELLESSELFVGLGVVTNHGESNEGLLPISVLMNDVEEFISEEAEEEAEVALAVSMIADRINALSTAMYDSPSILACYLRKNGHKDYAEFAENHQITDFDNWPTWLAFVRSLVKAGLLPQGASISIRNFFVDHWVARHVPVERQIEFAESEDESTRSKLYVDAALALGDHEMAELYRQQGIDAISDIADANLAFFGVTL